MMPMPNLHPVSPSLQDEQVWHAVADSTADPAEGVRLADETIRLVKLGRDLERYTLRQRRIVMVATPFCAVARGIGYAVWNWTFFWIVFACLSLSGIGYGLAQIHHASHYADLPVHEVGHVGNEALHSYFHGQPMPYFTTRSTTRTTWDGIRAWEVVFVGKHLTICSFVWRSSGGADHWANVPNCEAP